MESLGYTRNVIILTRPKGYLKVKPRFPKMFKVLLRDYPAMERAMLNRYDMYNKEMKEIEKREKKGQALVIRPPEDLGIKRTEKDPDELKRVYEIGRRTGEDVLGKVQDFMAKQN
jgi:predicted patatin/cPLA2 family phospholipase